MGAIAIVTATLHFSISLNPMMKLDAASLSRPLLSPFPKFYTAHSLRSRLANFSNGTINPTTSIQIRRRLLPDFNNLTLSFSPIGKTNFIQSSKSRLVLVSNSLSDDHHSSLSISDKKVALLSWAAITLILSVLNRVLHKLALIPMKDYPLFLAQINSLAYVAIFFPLLYMRYRAGLVTDDMLNIPKTPFIIMGFLESISIVSGMYAGAILPGPVIPLLYQTFLVWQLVFSRILLKRTYSLNQIAGCFLVAAGVVLAVTSGSNNGQMLSGIGIAWPLLMIASSAFQAGASIVKESVFLDAATRLKGKFLDVFVVNCFGSGVQAIFILLCLPILSKLKGMALSELPLYFKSGAACFLNIGSNTTGCEGAPMLPLLFMISSILFNISILNLLKFSDAIVASLAVRASVPFAIYVLSLPLPYLPKGVSLSPLFHLGSMILVVGLILYNIPKTRQKVSNTL